MYPTVSEVGRNNSVFLGLPISTDENLRKLKSPSHWNQCDISGLDSVSDGLSFGITRGQDPLPKGGTPRLSKEGDAGMA